MGEQLAREPCSGTSHFHGAPTQFSFVFQKLNQGRKKEEGIEGGPTNEARTHTQQVTMNHDTCTRIMMAAAMLPPHPRRALCSSRATVCAIAVLAALSGSCLGLSHHRHHHHRGALDLTLVGPPSILRRGSVIKECGTLYEPSNCELSGTSTHTRFQIGSLLGRGNFGNVYEVLRVNGLSPRLPIVLKQTARPSKYHYQIEAVLMRNENKLARRVLTTSYYKDVEGVTRFSHEQESTLQLLDRVHEDPLKTLNKDLAIVLPSFSHTDWNFQVGMHGGQTDLRKLQGESAWKHYGFDQARPSEWLEQVRRVAAAVAGGLHRLQSVGFMHNDVKADNIFCEMALIPFEKRRRDGPEWEISHVRLGDFGISTEIIEAQSYSGQGLGYAGLTCGSKFYMAPEVLNLERTYLKPTPKHDLWGLGLVLFEMASTIGVYGVSTAGGMNMIRVMEGTKIARSRYDPFTHDNRADNFMGDGRQTVEMVKNKQHLVKNKNFVRRRLLSRSSALVNGLDRGVEEPQLRAFVDLLEGLLQYDYDDRLDVGSVLTHPFIKGDFAAWADIGHVLAVSGQIWHRCGMQWNGPRTRLHVVTGLATSPIANTLEERWFSDCSATADSELLTYRSPDGKLGCKHVAIGKTIGDGQTKTMARWSTDCPGPTEGEVECSASLFGCIGSPDSPDHQTAGKGRLSGRAALHPNDQGGGNNDPQKLACKKSGLFWQNDLRFNVFEFYEPQDRGGRFCYMSLTGTQKVWHSSNGKGAPDDVVEFMIKQS